MRSPTTRVNRSEGWIKSDQRRNLALERIAAALEALGARDQDEVVLRDLARKTAEATYRVARMDEEAAALRRSLAKRAWADASEARVVEQTASTHPDTQHEQGAQA